MSAGSIPNCGDCLGLNLHPCAHVRCKVFNIIAIIIVIVIVVIVILLAINIVIVIHSNCNHIGFNIHCCKIIIIIDILLNKFWLFHIIIPVTQFVSVNIDHFYLVNILWQSFHVMFIRHHIWGCTTVRTEEKREIHNGGV